MKLAIIFIMLISSAFAQNRTRQEDRAIMLAENIERQIRAGVKSLDRKELRKLITNLRIASATLERSSGPVSPIPRPRVIVCAQDSVDIYQTTFKKMKNFAYSGAGLNYGSSEATKYAQKWAEQYPCNYANVFIKTFKYLKNFAYSGSGLNYGASQAKDYGLKNVDKFCSNYDLVGEFSKLYNFAYSGSGLNYGTSQARQYAKSRVEPQAFACQIRF